MSKSSHRWCEVCKKGIHGMNVTHVLTKRSTAYRTVLNTGGLQIFQEKIPSQKKLFCD